MAWSTRELANLTGTTVNTIRHYHRLGLLDLPEREDNGYKQYEVSHLVCLLRIRRLVSLGLPLKQIGDVIAGGDSSPAALREVDADLAARIEGLERARADIAAILQESAPVDTPAGFESVASQLSEADSSLIHIYRQMLNDAALADVRHMVDDDTDDVGVALAALTENADEAVRLELADRLALVIARNIIDYPWLANPQGHLSRSPLVAQQTFIEAMVELYNPAQLDVLARASVLAQEKIRDADVESGDGG